MRANLLNPESAINTEDIVLPKHAETISADLELETLFTTMAQEDKTIYEVVRKVILGLRTADANNILYRQAVLKDFMATPTLAYHLYQITLDTFAAYRDSLRFWLSANAPSRRLRSNIELMSLLLAQLEKLRDLGASSSASQAHSQGLKSLFKKLQDDFSQATLAQLHATNAELKFNNGMAVSAGLGSGNRGKNYVLQTPIPSKTWREKILSRCPADKGFTFTISQRDESGLTALTELRDHIVEPVATVMDAAVQNLLQFFAGLRDEVAFYVGALHLRDALESRAYGYCFPSPVSGGEPSLNAIGLYDPSLALTMHEPVIANDLQAEHKALLVITGANRGGKTTFLRTLGISQLLLQSGLFVPAQHFEGSLCAEVFTHFKQAEDQGMHSGKFDEELTRMRDLIPELQPTAMILFNESFAATNEREGSEIARQICAALMENRIRVIFVTHLYSFAEKWYTQQNPAVLLLRAERGNDGQRSFRIFADKPLSTSFGKDVYNKIFPEK